MESGGRTSQAGGPAVGLERGRQGAVTARHLQEFLAGLYLCAIGKPHELNRRTGSAPHERIC